MLRPLPRSVLLGGVLMLAGVGCGKEAPAPTRDISVAPSSENPGPSRKAQSVIDRPRTQQARPSR